MDSRISSISASILEEEGERKGRRGEGGMETEHMGNYGLANG